MARPRRRRIRVTLVLVPLVLVGLLLGVGGAVTCRPAWYEPTSIDYARLPGEKRAQLQLENQISAALNRRSRVEVELDEAQVNRWLVARQELWPGEVPSIEPFQRPQLVFLDHSRMRVAALVERSWLAVVLSMTVTVEVRGEELALRWSGVHAGALPVPRLFVQEALGELLRALGAPDEALLSGTVTLPNNWVWPNGKQRFRVVDVVIQDGLARLVLEPL